MSDHDHELTLLLALPAEPTHGQKADLALSIQRLVEREGPTHEAQLKERLGVTLHFVRSAMWFGKDNGFLAFHNGDLSVVEAVGTAITKDTTPLPATEKPADLFDGLGDAPIEDTEEPALSEDVRRACWCHAGIYGGCGLTFTGAGGFDSHRTGPWTARRCLTPDELREKGYTPNEHGRWGKPIIAESA